MVLVFSPGFGCHRPHAATADQDHVYRAEQRLSRGCNGPVSAFRGVADGPNLGSGIAATTGLTMGYYDGKRCCRMPRHAQHYAMSDRFFGTTFGPHRLAP